MSEDQEMTTPSSRKRGPLRSGLGFVGEVAIAGVIALVLTALLRIFVFQIFEVPSGSMENTLKQGDRITAMRMVDHQRGDVIVFEDPNGQWMGPQPTQTNAVRGALERIGLLPDSSKGYLVKRIIGLPGDHVVCCNQNGNITVNDVELVEEYLYTDSTGTMVDPSDTPFDVIVPVNSLFVMGDHRDRSGDSRLHLCQTPVSGSPPGSMGFVPTDNVVGPVKAIILPFDRMTTLKTPSGFAGVPDAGEAPAAPVLGEGTCSR
ncbi:signal peptidase I [Propionibacterium sp. oral taxon 192 str. F0372]|uniref:signal peptidase I n=1 Tax=Propionibacterium sp. oral taxon 192 TaxID=671222 RepID=UPI000353FF36|nr:signal peptidase I [Propionibacterium sp. oral taxon 192]EPH00239.1 signal peptidase I [Propionibacterium sp. oral taxon 192 str. F0372]